MGWEALIYAVVMIILSYALTPKVNNTSVDPMAETLDQIDFPQIEEGTAQAVIFGDCWSTDWMVLGVGDYRTSAIRKSQGGGGK